MTSTAVIPADGTAVPTYPAEGPLLRERPAVPFASRLAAHGDRLAVMHDGRELTYRELAERVAPAAARLGTVRRLVLIAASNHLDSLVWYLAALSGGHVALLAPPTHLASLSADYDPDVVVGPDVIADTDAAMTPGDATGDGDGDRGRDDSSWEPIIRHPETVHHLHPDLALLMSTSGSTGSPKLVRLSRQNLQANAESIADYLDIRDTDRAATSLPMHYCYGLSVVNSHLLRGAKLILTDLSVVDACFWDLFRQQGGTTFAGVPHTFTLLDRIGFADMSLPSLRYVTQAGGRLPADRVRHYAELGQEHGWDLFVMYGQTEATARMAYLPPDLAASHPSTVGIPVPGGSFRIDPVSDDDRTSVGELVYDGPNVMLGYANEPADLALGRTTTSLRTGDLARRTEAGLYEIVGRRAHFVKVAGHRIDLSHLEAVLATDGIVACCAGDDRGLVVALESDHDQAEVRSRLAQLCGLPPLVVHVCPVAQLPRLPSGKPDRHAVLALSSTAPPAGPAVSDAAAPETGRLAPQADPAQLRDMFAELLDRPDVTEDSTFVGLGGDSLSYVEVSVRLERALGRVPANWHTTPIRELVPAPRRGPGWGFFRRRTIETSVLLRAAAIVLVVGTHAGLFALPGGAHVLLAVAGFNFARFRLTAAGRVTRLRRQLTSIARIAVPSVVWIAGVVLLTGQYGWTNVVLLNGFLGPTTWTAEWHFWFIEILVYILLGVTALLAIPFVGRVERRFPFGFAVALLAAGLLTRFELVGVGVPHMMPAFWLFAIGWAAARAATWWQRLLLTAVIVASVPGFFGAAPREALMIGGLVLLVWTASVPWPAVASRVASVLASASLYIYLTHWQVYPLLGDLHPLVALLGSLVAGVIAWKLGTRASRLVVAGWDRLRSQAAILVG